MHKTQSGSALRARLLTIAAVIALLAFAISMLPRGFSDDVSKIGQGSNVTVLVHNKNSVKSMKLMELLNKVRSDYSGKIEFLVVDIDTGNGKTFAQTQQVQDSVLVLFDGSGFQRMILDDVKDEQGLILVLDRAFQL